MVRPEDDDAHHPHRSMPISEAEAMRLLATAPYGRVVFTRDALPAIRPVNHLVENGLIIVRTRLTSRLTVPAQANQKVVVAYQADDIDPVQHTGWSVVVTGIACTVGEPDRITRYDALLPPWADRATDVLVQIEPSIVNGIRLDGTASHDPESD